MPKKKLTLSVDATVIEQAKRFSRRNQTSVSRLVSAFLGSLDDEDRVATPVVRRLRGVLPSTVSWREYRAHVEAKRS